MKDKLALLKKIIEIQKALVVLKPDATGQGYKYASGEQLLAIARPKMDELGLLLLQEIVDSQHEHVEWRTSSGNKQQTYFHARFKFTWIDTESGETLSQLFEADGFNSWDKAAGSAMTYGERYFFMKTFHIPTDDMDPNQRRDNDDKQPAKTEKKEDKKPPKTDQPVKSDKEKRALIADMLIEINGTKDSAVIELEMLSQFEVDDDANPGQRKLVPGVKSTQELEGTRLNVIYGKVKTQHEAWTKEKK